MQMFLALENNTLLNYLQTILGDEYSLTDEQRLLITEDCENNRLSIETIGIVYSLVKCDPGKFSTLIRGNTVTLPGFCDSKPKPSEELTRRRKFLQRRAEEKEYNRMAHGTEDNPEKERILEQEQRISSFKNQLSITSNMIVSTAVSCGMGYYIGIQLKFDSATSLVFGLVAGILVMIIEMILFITRSVRMEQVIGNEIEKTSKQSRIH